MKSTTKKWVIGSALLALAIGGTVAVGGVAGDDDGDETPITGPALARASAAALAHTGGGRVTGTEVGDEEGAYEVEVTRRDGSQVDVHLDSSFRAIGSTSDRDGDDADDR